MAVTFSATPEPNNTPPRVRLDMATNDPNLVFQSIEIRRDGRLIRAIAPVGSSVSVAYDYDPLYSAASTYSVTGTTGGLSTLRNETWPNLSGWSTVSGTPAVAGGKLTSGVVSRTLAGAFPAAGQFVGSFPSIASNEIRVGPLRFTLAFPGFGDATIRTEVYAADLTTFLGSFNTLYESAGAFTAAWGNGQVTVTTLDATNSMAATPAAATFPLRCTAERSAFTVSSVISPAAFGPLTDSATLDSVEAWLLHPVNPDLSVQLSTYADGDRRDVLYVENGSGESVTYAAQREIFSPLGKQRQVPVTYGRRRLGEWSLVLRLPREQDRGSMLALLADQAPLLLRTPPTFPWDLADDWYSVGDVADERLLSTPTGNLRSITLPLLPVDEPVLVQGAEWTYGDDLARNATYADSLAEFPTYLDRLVGP